MKLTIYLNIMKYSINTFLKSQKKTSNVKHMRFEVQNNKSVNLYFTRNPIFSL